MTVWKSVHPTLDIPLDVTTWEWAFESKKTSPLHNVDPHDIGSYINAATKDRIDFHEVKRLATQLSTVLVGIFRLQPGQTVSLFSSNTIWYPVSMWATLRAGGRVNGASPSYTAEEMAHALKTAESKFLMTLPTSLPVAEKAASAVGLPKSRIFLLEGSATGYLSIHDLIQQFQAGNLTARPYWRIPQNKTNKDICGYLNFSSGTTGFPKAVMLSHHNVIAQCHQLRQLQLFPQDGSRYNILAVMPLFHITGLVRFCTQPVFLNGDCIMLPQYTFELMLQAIIEYRVEELLLVPPIITRLARDPVVDAYLPQLKPIVKRWSSGSAPTSPEVIQLLHSKFPDTGFRQGYGATESTACISAHPPSHFDFKYGAYAGKLMANTIAKVIDLDDPNRLLGPGETGEICAKGPQIAMGYLGNQEATREAFDKEGFLHTGDVGHIDTEGFLHIEDRIKEMIKVKGQQVAPAELEGLLLGLHEVEDCAVLGIPDEFAGERPKAFVVVKEGISPSVELGQKMMVALKQKTIRYKWLVEIEFVDSVPKNPTGKLLRRVLKARERQKKEHSGLRVRDLAQQSSKL